MTRSTIVYHAGVVSAFHMLIALMRCPREYLWVWFIGFAITYCLIAIVMEINLLRYALD